MKLPVQIICLFSLIIALFISKVYAISGVNFFWRKVSTTLESFENVVEQKNLNLAQCVTKAIELKDSNNKTTDSNLVRVDENICFIGNVKKRLHYGPTEAYVSSHHSKFNNFAWFAGSHETTSIHNDFCKNMSMILPEPKTMEELDELLKLVKDGIMTIGLKRDTDENYYWISNGAQATKIAVAPTVTPLDTGALEFQLINPSQKIVVHNGKAGNTICQFKN